MAESAGISPEDASCNSLSAAMYHVFAAPVDVPEDDDANDELGMMDDDQGDEDDMKNNSKRNKIYSSTA